MKTETQNPGRRETVRYHRQFYARNDLFEEGSWLSEPDDYVEAALRFLPRDEPCRVLDIGAGPGRHAIPIARDLAPGGEVDAVDLLPSAIEELRENASRLGVEDRINCICRDVEKFPVTPMRYHFILSCSSLEHVRDAEIFEKKLREIAQGTAEGGVVCLLINTNVCEHTRDGPRKSGAIEFPLSTAEGHRMLDTIFAGWEVHDQSTRDWRVSEQRDGEPITFASTCLRFLAER